MVLHRYRENDLWNSFREVDVLRQRLNHLFNTDTSDLTAGPAPYPLLNTWLSDEGATITAELPGLSPDDIDMSVVNDTLTIKGERPIEATTEGEVCHRRERTGGQFGRSIQLPFAINVDQVDAKFEKGILTVTLQRAESEKPKKITIKSK